MTEFFVQLLLLFIACVGSFAVGYYECYRHMIKQLRRRQDYDTYLDNAGKAHQIQRWRVP